jgi:hypothetical protein
MTRSLAHSVVVATEFVVAEHHRVSTILEGHRDSLVAWARPPREGASFHSRAGPHFDDGQRADPRTATRSCSVPDNAEGVVTPMFVVAAIGPVPDLATLLAQVQESGDLFHRAGVRKVSLFQAFDDRYEVMLQLEMTDQRRAQLWLSRSDAATAWLTAAGVGVTRRFSSGPPSIRCICLRPTTRVRSDVRMPVFGGYQSRSRRGSGPQGPAPCGA